MLRGPRRSPRPTRDAARRSLERVEPFVRAELGLELKGKGFIQQSAAGLTFVGFCVHPGALKLSRRRMRRYRAARDRWEAAYLAGIIDALELQRGGDGALAVTAHAASTGFRRAELRRRPGIEV